MAVWFEGEHEVECDLRRVKESLSDYGQHYVGVVSEMPGMISVELVDQGPDFVTIRTNEGLMERTSISTHEDAEQLVVEYDEKYEAGSRVTTTSHVRDEFSATPSGVHHRTVVSDLTAPGLLGLLYRTFGRSSMGKAFLTSYQTYLEAPAR